MPTVNRGSRQSSRTGGAESLGRGTLVAQQFLDAARRHAPAALGAPALVEPTRETPRRADARAQVDAKPLPFHRKHKFILLVNQNQPDVPDEDRHRNVLDHDTNAVALV